MPSGNAIWALSNGSQGPTSFTRQHLFFQAGCGPPPGGNKFFAARSSWAVRELKNVGTKFLGESFEKSVINGQFFGIFGVFTSMHPRWIWVFFCLLSCLSRQPGWNHLPVPPSQGFPASCFFPAGWLDPPGGCLRNSYWVLSFFIHLFCNRPLAHKWYPTLPMKEPTLTHRRCGATHCASVISHALLRD